MAYQKFITKEIERKMEKHPFGTQEGLGMDAEVIVKFFNPYGAGTCEQILLLASCKRETTLSALLSKRISSLQIM